MKIFGLIITVKSAKNERIRERWKTEVFKAKKQRASRLVDKIDKVIYDNFHLTGEDNKPSVLPIKKNAVVSYDEMISIWDSALNVRNDV